MSIEKHAPRVLVKMGFSFTTIVNNAMDAIQDMGTLGLYVYLCSKPQHWIIREKDLMNRFSCGRELIRTKMAKLKEAGLVSKSLVRDPDTGRILRWEIQVFDHVTENPSSGCSDKEFGEDVHMTGLPVPGETHLRQTRQHSKDRFTSLAMLEKDSKDLSLVDFDKSTKEKLKLSSVEMPTGISNQKKKSYQDDDRFMRFYKAYPRREKPQDAYKAFCSLNPSDDLLDKIISDVQARIERHTQWQNKKYIPLPASYIRSAAYDGEILNEQEEEDKKKVTKSGDQEKLLAQRIEEQNRVYEQRKQQVPQATPNKPVHISAGFQSAISSMRKTLGITQPLGELS